MKLDKKKLLIELLLIKIWSKVLEHKPGAETGGD